MSLGTRARQDIERLLKTVGSTFTLTNTPRTYDPATGTASAGTSSESTVRGKFFESKTERIALISNAEAALDPGIVQFGQRMVLLAARDTSQVEITPEIGDTVAGQDDDVRISGVSRRTVAGVTVAFVCSVDE